MSGPGHVPAQEIANAAAAGTGETGGGVAASVTTETPGATTGIPVAEEVEVCDLIISAIK